MSAGPPTADAAGQARSGGVGQRTRRPGRRPGSVNARGDIVASARAVFSERGYDGATMRLVAARAGVDPALIYHYFGSKQQLFVASMEIPFDWSTAFPELLNGPLDHVGDRLVRFMLGLWEDPEVQPRIMGLVRSAATDPEAAAMLRQLLTAGPVQGLAGAIGPPDGELRAMLAASHLIGLALLRYVLRIEPLASVDLDTLAALVGPRVTTYLVADPAANGAAARG